VGEWFQQTAGSGALVLAIPVAVLAGLVSFFSPCVLPLLPGYLSYATGLSGADLASGDVRRGRMVAGSLLFVLGFSVVFVGLGVLSANFFRFFSTNARTFDIVLGVLAILLGLAFLGLVPWMQRDVRVHRVPAVGLAAAPTTTTRSTQGRRATRFVMLTAPCSLSRRSHGRRSRGRPSSWRWAASGRCRRPRP